MAQDTPRNSGTNTSYGSGSTSGPGSSPSASGGRGTGFDRSTSGGGLSKASETCASCGRSMHDIGNNAGLEQFLGRIGISEEMVNKLKTSMQNVDIDEYLNTAREYLKDSTSKAKSFTKENPGKVAAGVAVLAIGAGLLLSALNKD